MPDPWYPGAVRRGGVNAGYRQGHSKMQVCVRHYTVGRDSTSIGLSGYFQFLVSRDGTVQQFAEVDAICWHAGEWNSMGPGIEVEYLDEPDVFTPEALTATTALVAWLTAEWGMPADQYLGPRIPNTTVFTGFLDHASLEQAEEHFDFWPQEAWQHIVPIQPPVPPVDPQENPDMYVMVCNERQQVGVVSEYRVAGYPMAEYATAGGAPVINVTGAEFDAEVRARQSLAAKR